MLSVELVSRGIFFKARVSLIKFIQRKFMIPEEIFPFVTSELCEQLYDTGCDLLAESKRTLQWMIENYANSICISRQVEYVGGPSHICRRPTGTDRRTLLFATGDYVAVSSDGYEKQP